MKDKHFYTYLFLHAGIITLWVILDKMNKVITHDGTINLLSIAILLYYFNLLYLHVMASRQETTIFEYSWNILSISFIASLMYSSFSNLYACVFLFFELLLGIMIIKTNSSKGRIISFLFGSLAITMSFFNLKILSTINILLGIFLGIFIDYRYINLKQINILPITQTKAKYILVFITGFMDYQD